MASHRVDPPSRSPAAPSDGLPVAVDGDARLALAAPRSSTTSDDWEAAEPDPRWEIPPEFLDEVGGSSGLRTTLHIVLSLAMLGLVVAWIVLSRSLTG